MTILCLLVLYLLVVTCTCLCLYSVSLMCLLRGRCGGDRSDATQFLGSQPPVSILVPAHNEEQTIDACVRSLLRLDYPDYEVIVCNDGSRDGTLDHLMQALALEVTPATQHNRISTRRVRAVYVSATHPGIRVIDKVRGGKGDALNAALNVARFPLFCTLDADSILQGDSLKRIVQPFIENPSTVAASGVVCVLNGCQVTKGELLRRRLPRSALARFQSLEYLRTFLTVRAGWAPLNALMIVPGAFGLFHKETVLRAGGYRTDTVGEDMELIVRLHRLLRRQETEYRIAFCPDALCWTEVPEELRTLRNQRIRWQRGLCESLMLNRDLLFHRRGGAPGWLAFPFYLVFEALGPLLELAGLALLVIGVFSGLIPPRVVVIGAALTAGFGLLLSAFTLHLEHLVYCSDREDSRANKPPGATDAPRGQAQCEPRRVSALYSGTPRAGAPWLLAAEALCYRPLIWFWRLAGLWSWARRTRAEWGPMRRTAAWNCPVPPQGPIEELRGEDADRRPPVETCGVEAISGERFLR